MTAKAKSETNSKVYKYKSVCFKTLVSSVFLTQFSRLL